MNTRTIWMILAGFAAIALILIMGIFIGERNYFNQQQNNVTIIGPNKEIKNSLSEINRKSIYGLNNGQVVVVGEMLYKIVNNQTEVLIQITNAPKQLKLENNVRDIPLQLKVSGAIVANGGFDYGYEEIGTVRFDASGAVLKTDFSTILPKPLGSYDRLVFEPTKEEDNQTFFRNTDPDLPVNVRAQLSPYFWIII